MFTGIVQRLGKIAEIEQRKTWIDPDAPGIGDLHIGDSVAVNGVCLTVVAFAAAPGDKPGDKPRDKPGGRFAVSVSQQTCSCTTFATLQVGSRVNLEPSLTLSTPLGGHLVHGHVDGVGEILACTEREDHCQLLRIQAPADLARYLCLRGSICVDGISLTLSAVQGRCFESNLIPHTLGQTTLGQTCVGSPVNLEVDPIARYVERLLDFTRGEPPPRDPVGQAS